MAASRDRTSEDTLDDGILLGRGEPQRHGECLDNLTISAAFHTFLHKLAANELEVHTCITAITNAWDGH